MKRGQISWFILIGLFVFISTAILFNYSQNVNQIKEVENNKYLEIQNYFENCVKNIANEEIKDLALSGFYSKLGNINLVDENYPRVHIYYLNNTVNSPTTEEMQTIIQNRIYESAIYCLDANYAPDQYVDLFSLVEINDLKINVEIDKLIQIKVIPDYKIITPNVEIEFSNFEFDYDIKLNEIQFMYNEILNEISNNNELPISYMTDNDYFNYNIYYHNDHQMIIEIIPIESDITNYKYRFGVDLE